MRARTLCFIPYSLCKARPRAWQVTCSQEAFTEVLDDKQWLQVVFRHTASLAMACLGTVSCASYYILLGPPLSSGPDLPHASDR